MRLPILKLLLCLLLATPIEAGIYNFAEPDEWNLPSEYKDAAGAGGFNNAYKEILSIYGAIEIDTAQGKEKIERPRMHRYRMYSLLSNTKKSLTLDQHLAMTAAMIRLNVPEVQPSALEAMSLLRGLTRSPYAANFAMHAHLAAAQASVGEFSSAQESQQQVLDLWPKNIAEFKAEQPALYKLWMDNGLEDRLAFYRQVEELQLILYRVRMREAVARGKEKSNEGLTPYDLFGKPAVKYVGESGNFEVGTIAAQEKAKLPADALRIVQQLVIWNPHDDRLYWQLGELYNAQGGKANIEAARAIFYDLVKIKRVRSPEIFKRWEILSEHVFPPERKDSKPPFEVKTLLIGLGVGALAGVFLYWQIQALRRRKRPEAAG